MEIVLFIAVGIALGVVIGYLFANAKKTAAIATHQAEIAAREATTESLRENTIELKEQMNRLNENMSRLQADKNELFAENQTLGRELELLREQTGKEADERQKQFGEQLKLVQEQLKTATDELLKRRAEELSANNNTQMNAIVNPLKETIREMKTAMESNRDTGNKNTASLEKAIEEVLKRANAIGSEADKLAKALRSENKIQGNWGEIILDELLRSQGLEEGKHYHTQATLRDGNGQALRHDETGKRMIPDVVLHYPDDKDAVIDAKVSLTAFLEYQNAQTDEEREDALNRHLNSIRGHVKELSRKDYSRYINAPRQSLDYVIMFVPVEAALQLALYNDTSLWRNAFENGVFITSEQNLTAALRMIKIAWVHMAQTQNQEEVFRLASDVVKRVGEFYERFSDIGSKIEAVAKAYDHADKKLLNSTQSLVAPARKLVKLGAREDARKPLPNDNQTLFAEE